MAALRRGQPTSAPKVGTSATAGSALAMRCKHLAFELTVAATEAVGDAERVGARGGLARAPVVCGAMVGGRRIATSPPKPHANR